MKPSNPPLQSREAALAVAEAYESALNLAIQVTRLQDDAESVKYLKDHLDFVRRSHGRIASQTLGTADWGSFCRYELDRMKSFLLDECIPRIKDLLA